jgi:hypothetical protein
VRKNCKYDARVVGIACSNCYPIDKWDASQLEDRLDLGMFSSVTNTGKICFMVQVPSINTFNLGMFLE